MANPNLTFNVLTFDHPATEYTFHFYKEPQDLKGFGNLSGLPVLQRVYHALVPNEVKEHFGEQEHYYTSFEENREGALAVTKLSKPTYNKTRNENGQDVWIKQTNSAFSKSMLKRFYIHQIQTYFQSIGVLVSANFVEDIEIWLPAKNSNATFNLFDKYALKIQIAEVSNKPEILVTFEGQSKVFRKSIAELMSLVTPDCFNWVLYENSLCKFDDLSDTAKRNYSKVYAAFNFKLRDALHLPTEAPDRTNPYIKYKRHISFLFDRYLNNEAFKKIIPIDCNNFIEVKDKNIGTVSDNTNILLFGDSKQHRVPHMGMDSFGPLALPDFDRIQFFYIFPLIHQEKVELLMSFFKNGLNDSDGKQLFKGIYDYAKVPYHTEPLYSISFNNIEDPIPELRPSFTSEYSRMKFSISLYMSARTVKVTLQQSKNQSITRLKKFY